MLFPLSVPDFTHQLVAIKIGPFDVSFIDEQTLHVEPRCRHALATFAMRSVALTY